jgi:hypothetical protein
MCIFSDNPLDKREMGSSHRRCCQRRAQSPLSAIPSIRNPSFKDSGNARFGPMDAESLPVF